MVVERAESLGRVCHSIDLNPVRAGVAGVDQMESDRFGSFARLMHPKEKPVWMDVSVALQAAGGLGDTPKGRAADRNDLGWIVEEVKAGRKPEYLELSKGWAIGGEQFQEELRLRFAEQVENGRAMDPAARKQCGERQWQGELQGLMDRLNEAERRDTRSSAVWKVVVGWSMKSQTDTSNGRLASAFNLGSATSVSKQAGLVRDGRLGTLATRLAERLKSKD